MVQAFALLLNQTAADLYVRRLQRRRVDIRGTHWLSTNAVAIALILWLGAFTQKETVPIRILPTTPIAHAAGLFLTRWEALG